VSRPVVSNTTPNGQLVGGDGKATYAFGKWLQSIGTTVNNGFDSNGNYQGPIGDNATIDGRETLASIVQNISTQGVVQASGIDFAIPYLNKDTDHIADGTGHPLAGGKVAYAALVASTPIAGQTIRFDGTDWLPVAIAVSKPVTVSQWLNSYDAATGTFTASQPDFTDISGAATAAQIPALSALSGQITISQLPAAGISVTITTFGPTTNGSMTFVNGLLTAQVQAT
jgi:hypothetical protein